MKLSKPRHFASLSTFERYVLNAAKRELEGRLTTINQESRKPKANQKELSKQYHETQKEIRAINKAVKKTYEDSNH